ncbi:MAG TPA: class I SAM-dependent methyltransferase [Pyrinomonadaceae bacterium]|jgi:2-polyprenyl-3-methyl-5-hydroxy-6-metoxy-1,4-benzoquinol methylase
MEAIIATETRPAETARIPTPIHDQAKAEAFAGRMLDVLNGGALALMISLGHRAKLFDAMSGLKPSTSVQIAEAAGLNERYVREWLGAMVTGAVVEYDPASGTYCLPTEHAAFITRAASPNNMAVTAQFISLLGAVEDRVLECFRNGGGVPYSAFPRFHEVMAEESAQTVLAALVDSILPLAQGVTERLVEGAEVLDVGCGSGRALILLAETFPHSQFNGYDFSEEGIAKAVTEAATKGLRNIRFEVKDVASLVEREKYDLITAFDAIHDQAHPARVLNCIANALRPGGTFLMQDIAGSSHVQHNMEHPIAPFGYTVSCMHCMTVSLAQGGDGLGAMWGEEKAQEMLKAAGFTHIEMKKLPHDIINTYYVAGTGQVKN